MYLCGLIILKKGTNSDNQHCGSVNKYKYQKYHEQHHGLRSTSQLKPLCVEFACCVCDSFLPQSTPHAGLLNWKLEIACRCDLESDRSPRRDWERVPKVPPHITYSVCWHRLQGLWGPWPIRRAMDTKANFHDIWKDNTESVKRHFVSHIAGLKPLCRLCVWQKASLSGAFCDSGAFVGLWHLS